MNKKHPISFFVLNLVLLFFTSHYSLVYSQTIGFQCLDVNIEILQANGVDEASEVKVAQWQGAFSGSAPDNVIFNENFVGADQDRFFIRIKDEAKAGQGTIRCNISTFGHASNGFTRRDRITNITLQESSEGLFISPPIVLVSNAIDDNYDEVSGQSDQTLNIFSENLEADYENTRTGGFILVEYDFVTGSGPVEGSTQIANCSLDICMQEIIQIRLFSIKNSVNGTPFDGLLEKMREEVAKMNLVWAQSCIRVEIVEERIVDPPKKEDNHDDGYMFEGVLIGKDDGMFSFLDYGPDGIINTNDRGEMDGVHTDGELSENFDDVNGNNLYDESMDFSQGILDLNETMITNFQFSGMSGEERHLIDTYADGMESTVEFFGVIGFSIEGLIRGRSYQTSGPMNPFLNTPNQIVVESPRLGLEVMDRFTGAHELGHVITQRAIHEPNNQVLGSVNLMRNGTSAQDGLKESKRLNN